MKYTVSKILAALFLACTTAGISSAVPITGQIDISGTVHLDTSSLATATRVVSWSNVTVSNVTAGSILDSTINPLMAVTMPNSWTFGSGQAALWSVGGFTFDLVSSAIVHQDASFLTISGAGWLSGNGYDATPGLWGFSTQNIISGENTYFSFSATSAAVPSVPDSGITVMLLGLSLVAVGFASRRVKIV